MNEPAPTFFRIVSSHVTVLAATRDGAMASISPVARPPGFAPLLAFNPHPDSRIWFLMAPNLVPGAALSARPEKGFGAVIPVIAHESGTALLGATSGLLLTISPLDPRSKIGPIAFAATALKAYERITFKTLSSPDIPKIFLAWAEILTRLHRPTLDPVALAALFDEQAFDATLTPALDAAASLLSTGDIALFAETLLTKGPRALANLRTTYADDLSATYALPEMADRLLHGAEPPHRRAIGPELDGLDQEGLEGTFVSLPFACNIAWRRMAKSRKRACVVATARNEGLYLLEWIAHHKAIGFDHLFIYSNDNTDGSDDLLRALAEAGEITWIENTVGTGRRAQWKAYGHALRVMPDVLDYDWALFIDLDEFFVPDPARFSSLAAFIDDQERQEVDAIALNWMMVGANGEAHWRDDVLRRRFPAGRRDANPHVKTMLRPSRFIHSYPHDPISYRDEPWVFRNGGGTLHLHDPNTHRRALSINPDYAGARIVHFFYKSAAEFLWKASRNRGDHAVADAIALVALRADFIIDFVIVSGEAGAPTQMDYWGAEVDRGIAALRALPGVNAAEEACKAAYARQIPEILRSAQDHPMILKAGASGQWLLDAVARDATPA